MPNCINKLVYKHKQKSVKPRNYRPLLPDIYELFKNQGEGVFYSNLKSRENNVVAKAIGKITQCFNKKNEEDINLTHTVAILYSESLREWFNDEEWGVISTNWYEYYKDAPPLDNSIKLLVLASADADGMNFFNFSHYQLRDFSLRKLPLPKEETIKIVKRLITVEPAPYDATGLIFWPIYKILQFFKFLDDPKSYFCSELYDIVKEETGFEIAEGSNPSPLGIENYRLDLRFYVTKNFLTS